MKKYIKSTRWLLIITAAIIVIDQITKFFVREYIPFGTQWAPWDWLLPYARLLHISNTGAAFGLFKNANVVLMILAVVVSAAILWYYPRVPEDQKIIRLALSLQLAGALGNLIDRIFFGYVTDFISVGKFAIFNVADSSITVGVLVLLAAVWWQDRKEKQNATVDETQASTKEIGSEN